MNRCNIFRLSAITALGLALLSSAAFAQQKTFKEAILGTWVVTSTYDQYANDKNNETSSPGIKGDLVFGSDGSYSQIIIGDSRAE